jgi:hypothetical protein
LAAFLAGYYDRDSLSRGREAGAFFESLILYHLKVLAQLLTPRGRLFYWRTTTGHEVDFVLEQGRRLLAFEVKLTTSPRFGDADGPRLFQSRVSEQSRTWLEARCGIMLWRMMGCHPQVACKPLLAIRLSQQRLTLRDQ